MTNRVYLCLAHMSGKEMQYIQEAFDTNWVVPLGPNVNGFEKDLEEFVGENKRVVALSSGTAAVHLGLIAAGVKAGDEVLVQSFTFCASTHPITYLGATPVLIDSEPDTWNLDPVLLEEAIKDRIAKTGKKNLLLLYLYIFMVCQRKLMKSWQLHRNTKFPSLKMQLKVWDHVIKDKYAVLLENLVFYLSTVTK